MPNIINNDIDSIAKEYGAIVTAISYRMIEDRDLAQDAAQEAWIEIIRSLPSFKGESKISTWIYTIAARTILRHSKNEKKYSVRFISEFLDGDEIIYSDSGSEEKEWVREMCDKCITGSVHCLTNEERLILLLNDAAGLDSKEISEILPVTDTAVRKKISRSRKKLHSFLNNQCILYNPEGNCKCRMIKNVNKINLQKEFQRIKADINEISFLRQCDEILSDNKIFFHKICHNYDLSPTN
jgi:RNA polymerase sigma factor (sigma-70 family)